VAWPGVHPSPSGEGEAYATQEPVPVEEPMLDAEDEPVPPEAFIFETDPVSQEEATALKPTSLVHISPAPIPEDSQPSTPAMEPEHPILQDAPAALVLYFNEDQPQDEQDV